MKIGLVIPGKLDERSGGYLYDKKLVEYLEARGLELVVISLPEISYWKAASTRSRNLAAKQIVSAQCDLLIEDELSHPYLHKISARDRSMFPPRIALVHHLRVDEKHPWFLKTAIYRVRESRFLNAVDAFIWNGVDTKRSVAKLLRTGDFRGVVARPWISRELHTIAPEASETSPTLTSLLFVGNIMRRKNLHILIRALLAFGTGAPHLNIVGSEAFEPRYVAYCRKLASKRPEKFVFHGRVEPDALRFFYRNSQVLVLPSAHEGYGIVYLEAMHQGLAVIGSSRGGAPEAIGPGGLLVEPGRIAPLFKALKRLHNEPSQLAELRKKGLAHAQQHPRWEDSFALIHEMLYDLVRTNPIGSNNRR